MMPSPFEGELLKFSKGSYIAPNDEAIDLGTTFIAGVPGTVVGWQKWRDGKPVQYEMGYVRDGYRPPCRADLGDNDSSTWEVDDQGQRRDPWQITIHLPLTQCETSRQFSFATSSKGGIGAVAKLAGTYAESHSPTSSASSRSSLSASATIATITSHSARSSSPSSHCWLDWRLGVEHLDSRSRGPER